MKHVVRTAAAGLVVALMAPVGVVAAARASSDCPLPTFGPGASYHPQYHAEDFSPKVDNPIFPLQPGRTLIYSGTKDGKKALNVFAITKRTKVIAGVTTRVVQDRLYLNNVLEERTADYYAQDKCGNVWYFGEDTATLDAAGHVVSTDGSFRAGVDGAQPGVFCRRSRRSGGSSAKSGPRVMRRIATPRSIPTRRSRSRPDRSPMRYARRNRRTSNPAFSTTSTTSRASAK